MARESPSPSGRSGESGASTTDCRVVTAGNIAARWTNTPCLDGVVAGCWTSRQSQRWPADECDGWCAGRGTEEGRVLLPRSRPCPPHSAGYTRSHTPAGLDGGDGGWCAGHWAGAPLTPLGGVMRPEPRPELLDLPDA